MKVETIFFTLSSLLISLKLQKKSKFLIVLNELRLGKLCVIRQNSMMIVLVVKQAKYSRNKTDSVTRNTVSNCLKTFPLKFA